MPVRFITRLIVILAFITVVLGVIAYARGYRFDLDKKSLSSTGIISVNSNPTAAKIYVNDELKGVTNTNLILAPNNYEVTVKKDGYTGWKKTINLKGELVMTIDAILFPLNPSLSPLTNLGVVKAIALDQTDNILLFVDNNTVDDGIYLFDATKKPINLISPLKLILAKKLISSDLDFSPTAVVFSPDFKQGIFEFASKNGNDTSAYLLSLDAENTTLFDVTASKQTLLDAWEQKKTDDQLKILETYPPEIAKIASDSFHILSFSPNETKMLYQSNANLILPPGITPPMIATNQTKEVRTLQKDHYYIYDKKEDKNYEISLTGLGNEARIVKGLRQTLPNSETSVVTVADLTSYIQWYPDSRHLVVNETKRIVIMEYDGSNPQTVYSAPFDNTYITTTSDGNLIVLSNLNPEANKYPDLYAVGIR